MIEAEEPHEYAARWSYSAAVMARHLGAVLARGQTNPDDLCRGVYLSVRRFLDAVLDGLRGHGAILQDRALALARWTLQRTLARPPRERSDAEADRFFAYMHIFTRLEHHGTLSPAEQTDAHELAAFFQQLSGDGEDALYAVHVASAHADLDTIEIM
ncbi:MAG: hypothetical protein Q7S96_05095 [bacterium]|nr:hypothetical protein [bacterium]